MKFQVETVIIALNAITTSSAAAFNEPVAVALPTATSSKAESELANYERNLGADNEGEGQPLGIPMPTTTRLRGRVRAYLVLLCRPCSLIRLTAAAAAHFHRCSD
eukprot:scaffold5856_cov159-Skeletonema_dohrnii-CCMP3373.AAC.4